VLKGLRPRQCHIQYFNIVLPEKIAAPSPRGQVGCFRQCTGIRTRPVRHPRRCWPAGRRPVAKNDPESWNKISRPPQSRAPADPVPDLSLCDDRARTTSSDHRQADTCTHHASATRVNNDTPIDRTLLFCIATAPLTAFTFSAQILYGNSIMRPRAAASVTAPLRGIRLSSPARTAFPRQHTQRTLCTSCRRTRSGLERLEQLKETQHVSWVARSNNAPGQRRFASTVKQRGPLAEYDRRVAAGTLRNDEHQRGTQTANFLTRRCPL
jgi:hypothetical protein